MSDSPSCNETQSLMSHLAEIAQAHGSDHVFVGIRNQAGRNEIVAELFIFDLHTDRPTVMKVIKV